jgi:hypothetical protein
MKYLCLVYFDEKRLEGLSDEEREALERASLEYDEELLRNGYCSVSEALQPARTATTVHVRKSKISVTDGPFAETQEQLGGFYLIEARDLNEAINVATKIPAGRLGGVEVRPVRTLGG